MLQTAPVGMDDFRKLRELTKKGKRSKYYVDKTLFILRKLPIPR